MRLVLALGGNALMRRGEPLTVATQRRNAQVAARAIAPLAREHQLVVTHGNGPQVGLLALRDAAQRLSEASPLDVLVAESEGMIGYMIEQEIANLLPADFPIATVLTTVEVDGQDPAFDRPTKFIGPVYDQDAADRLRTESGWRLARDGDHWRRVVPSPRPRRIRELRPIEWLLEKGTMVIAAGGGGIPVVRAAATGGALVGVEAVVDKDATSALLARALDADLLVLATDVAGVYRDFGQATARLIRRISPAALARLSFPAGSMGPKVAAALDFVAATGRPARIGALDEFATLIRGEAGTSIDPAAGESDA